ncbi:amidohydrolase family protein [Pseudoruegeria sp. SK021]|uniref:amidohydrolase family protein n=1 Tax=Pseudoruegeria sp. SK021 TaxID=1933035 RepID=UPI000A221362|nr:amidohydrolase family protein [Pseudoruegeria sp. SK021]OSP53407.1 amidohydrolase [Pseudoruegeria sp. SK021]
MTVALLTARWIVTGAADNKHPAIQEDAALAHEDGVVLAVGPIDEIRRAYPGASETAYPKHMILPGFVNSHHHVGLTPLQMGSPDYALELWFAGRLSARDIDPYLDTLYSAFEMIASGITSVQHIQGWARGDYGQVHGAASAVLAAYEAIGMRVSYCYAVREQNRFVYEADEDFCRRLPPDAAKAMAANLEAQKLSLEEFLQLFDELTDANQNPRARIQLAPANLHWMTDDGLLALKERSDSAGVPMHMHLLETAYQKEYARRRTGTTAVKHLEKLGILGPKLTIGHGVWMTEEDIDIIAHSGTCLCHNCSSNFRLRSGLLPLMEYQKRGVTVGLGLDEAGINEDRDMLQEMRLALNVHRVPGMNHDNVPTPTQVFRMASEHGAMTTAFGSDIGRLDPGRRLDAVIVDYDAATYPFQDPDIPPLDAIVQRAKSAHVHAVLVDGEVIYQDGRFTRIDRDEILEQIAKVLSAPKSQDEQHRHWLRDQVFGEVEKFYSDYLNDATERTPFYGTSSRH